MNKGVWLGTMFGGVNYLPHKTLQFDQYVPGSNAHSLSTKQVREIVEAADGTIWIGTENDGINVLNPFSGKISKPAFWRGGLDKNLRLITLSMYTHDDEVYCGLFKHGLDIIRQSGEKVSHYESETLSLGNGSIYSLFIDNSGNVWIGSDWGLYKAVPGTLHFEKIREVGDDWIFDVFQDRDGMLWFASMGSGLWKHNPRKETFHKYTHERDKEKSLSSNSISSVMQDSKGHIWVSTDRGGICRYNAKTDDFTTISIKDGLPGNQFNYKSTLKGKDGKFYFGSIDGLISFNPNVPEEDNTLSPLYISKFSINNTEVTVHTPDSPLKSCIEHTDKITLPYDHSNISFDIAKKTKTA